MTIRFAVVSAALLATAITASTAAQPARSGDAAVDAIFARCRALVPDLTSVRTVKSGIRPVRAPVRVEREARVIHNYGHGGAGFTVSWGCAMDVLALVRHANA